MSTATLKKAIGDGGAFFDDSHGADNLWDVLNALCNAGEVLTIKEASPSEAIKASIITDVATRISNICVNAGTTGTDNQIDIDVNVDGVQVAQVTILNSAADGIFVTQAIDVDVPAQSLVEIEFTDIPTDAANITATLRMKPVTVEI